VTVLESAHWIHYSELKLDITRRCFTAE